ncbi:DUF4214 domain-containing protein [Tianweitania sp.]|uniref:DUF4214 domain-containing protein n=1 Tax=Tianweitania sp. TaxID=2021634 RepID=UPI00289BB8EF|nr:DUF4214 domain-containing protein [Tianweitania sp.]
MASIQGIYIALFGRPADPLGLQYFNSITNGGRDLSQINSLAGEAEYQDRFQGYNNAQIVTQIYQDLYGRDPDAAGLAYFVAELNSGRQNINTIAINILDGARGADLTIVTNKVAAANLFTQNVDTQIEIASYVGADAAAAGRAYLSAVTADPATVPTAAQAQAAVQGVVDASNAGNLIDVANGDDVVVGEVGSTVDASARNDTVRVIGDYDASGDINTGFGSDTVNVGVAAAVATTETSLVGVERLNVISNGATGALDLSDTSGLQQVWAVGSANALEVSGLSVTGTVGLQGSGTGATTITFSDVGGTNDSATLSVASFDANAVTRAVAVDGIENLTLSTTTEATLAVTDADLVNLTVTGTGDVTLSTALGNDVVRVDASALSGDFTVTLSGNETTTVIGGAGDDVFNLTATAEGTVITGGAGVDVFNSVGLANLNAIGTNAAILEDVIKITDFSANDLLDLGVTGDAATFNVAESNAITTATTLTDALTAVGAATAADGVGYAIFQYQGSTYVYVDNGTAGFDAGDGLVQLTGYTGALPDANFVH